MLSFIILLQALQSYRSLYPHINIHEDSFSIVCVHHLVRMEEQVSSE